MPIPGLNIFIMSPPARDEKKSKLVEMLERKRKEEMHQEAIEKMEAIASTVSHTAPITSHMGGG